LGLSQLLRPEIYDGLMQMQKDDYQGVKRAYSLPDAVFTTRGSWLAPHLKAGVSDQRPVYDLDEFELAGLPLLVELGTRDVDQGSRLGMNNE